MTSSAQTVPKMVAAVLAVFQGAGNDDGVISDVDIDSANVNGAEVEILTLSGATGAFEIAQQSGEPAPDAVARALESTFDHSGPGGPGSRMQP